MSSWIPSLFNPKPIPRTDSDDDNPTSPSSSSPRTAASGVKDDLSAVFRGVAVFLAPPHGLSSSAVPFSSSSSSSDAIAGIKNDLAEIQGSLKSGLSLISSKLTSNFLQFQGQLSGDNDNDYGDEVEEEDEDAVGITEEVVGFVEKLSTRPELWIDFPLSLADDFELSDHQRVHAANIDYLVPELVTLRKKISSQISEGKFWMVYFILLFPRLSEEALKLLSAPQVVEARKTLLKKLQSKSNTTEKTSENHSETSETILDVDEANILEGDERATQYKNMSEIVNSQKPMKHNGSEEEGNSRTSVDAREQSQDEDISFSDLEDEDNDLSEKISGLKVFTNRKGEASEWIQLYANSGGQGGEKIPGLSVLRDKESESGDSNDWLAVDDKDFDNLGGV